MQTHVHRTAPDAVMSGVVVESCLRSIPSSIFKLATFSNQNCMIKMMRFVYRPTSSSIKMIYSSNTKSTRNSNYVSFSSLNFLSCKTEVKVKARPDKPRDLENATLNLSGKKRKFNEIVNS